ncbi:hypothetical protein JX266_002032 [Neoarthrinium moseri]|nr:hypothetical protein JX266_002032 [Neoarthrinium moseri]
MALRRSASQIFGSPHPALQGAREGDDGASAPARHQLWRGHTILGLRASPAHAPYATSKSRQRRQDPDNNDPSFNKPPQQQFQSNSDPAPVLSTDSTQSHEPAAHLNPTAGATQSCADLEASLEAATLESTTTSASLPPPPYRPATSNMAPAASPFSAPATQALQPTMPVLKGFQAAWETHAVRRQQQPRDAATLHPVFFSDCLQRAPLVADAALASPVALGYGYPREGPRL